MVLLESKLNTWEAKKVKCDESIIHINEVQAYKVDKFLLEKPDVDIHVDFLFVSRENLELWNVVIEHCLEECPELVKEI